MKEFSDLKVACLCGGVGAAKFVSGLARVIAPNNMNLIVNTGDDFYLHGLKICPDIDSIIYWLANLSDEERGWGIRGETYNVLNQLKMLKGETWFILGDKDLATHLYRTQRLKEGVSLAEVTLELVHNFFIEATVFPMTNSDVSTWLTVKYTKEKLDFQTYFVKYKQEKQIESIEFLNASNASPVMGALESLENADLIFIAPSNPFLSIDPILAIKGYRDLLIKNKAKVVAVSPLIGRSALKGPLDHLMLELGYEVNSAAIAKYYESFISYFVLDTLDSSQRDKVELLSITPIVKDTKMTSREKTAKLCSEILSEALN